MPKNLPAKEKRPIAGIASALFAAASSQFGVIATFFGLTIPNYLNKYIPYVALIFLFLSIVLWSYYLATNKAFFLSVRRFLYRYKKADVYVYNAAHYIVSRNWSAPQVVGYGNEVGRLRSEGTQLWRSVSHLNSDVEHLKLTPEEEADAIRRTRVENVNKALDWIREKSCDDLPIWTEYGCNQKIKFLNYKYWLSNSFTKITDDPMALKRMDSASLSTRALEVPSTFPSFHTLKTNRPLIEKYWPPENPPRSVYGSLTI